MIKKAVYDRCREFGGKKENAEGVRTPCNLPPPPRSPVPRPPSRGGRGTSAHITSVRARTITAPRSWVHAVRVGFSEVPPPGVCTSPRFMSGAHGVPRGATRVPDTFAGIAGGPAGRDDPGTQARRPRLPRELPSLPPACGLHTRPRCSVLHSARRGGGGFCE